LRQFDLALANFVQVLKIDDTYILANVNRASINTALGKNDQAIKDYQKVLELNPDTLDANFNLGIIYYKMEKYQLAIECMQKFNKLSPSPDSYNLIAVASIKLNKYPNTMAAQDEAVSSFPNIA
jgi:tetratricopeptide (TPR) repeat protein